MNLYQQIGQQNMVGFISIWENSTLDLSPLVMRKGNLLKGVSLTRSLAGTFEFVLADAKLFGFLVILCCKIQHINFALRHKTVSETC